MNLGKRKKEKQPKDTQLAMPIKKSRADIVYGLKRNLDRQITFAGVIPYWRNFFFVAAFMSSVMTILVLSYVLYQNYEYLPLEIPMLFNQATQTWTTISRDVLTLLPVSIVVFTVLATYLNARIYRFDRRLVLMLSLSIILANLFLLIGLGQILSLLLVY